MDDNDLSRIRETLDELRLLAKAACLAISQSRKMMVELHNSIYWHRTQVAAFEGSDSISPRAK